MKTKMLGSYYPNCSSKQRMYSKREMIDGVFEIQDGTLVFTQKFLLLFKLKSNSISIPLRDIDHLDTMNLNGFMPFGVCVFMKDGREFMFGHMNNKKLKLFIEEARLSN